MQSPSQKPSESFGAARFGDEMTVWLVLATENGVASTLAAAMSITDQDSTAIATNLRQLTFITMEETLSPNRDSANAQGCL